MTQILFTSLFILGCMFALAGRASEGAKKRIYYIVAGGLWVLILVLANLLLWKPTDPNAQVVSEYYSYAVVSNLLKNCEASTHPLPNHTAQGAVLSKERSHRSA